MPNTAQDWTEHLDPESHPEGGYYRETYRIDKSVSELALPDRFGGQQDGKGQLAHRQTRRRELRGCN
jgi:predicted cupin superfamily sugar epimerase